MRSASVGGYITWMTCHPNADLTGARSDPAPRPGFMIAPRNASSTLLVESKYGQLAAGAGRRRARSSRRSRRGRSSRTGRGSALIFAYAARASASAAAHDGSVSGMSPLDAADGSSFGEYRMCRTLMLSAGRSAAAAWIQISLTSRCGPGFVASATTLSSSFWWMTSPATTARYFSRSMPSFWSFSV